jgi:hypothetical protein
MDEAGAVSLFCQQTNIQNLFLISKLLPPTQLTVNTTIAIDIINLKVHRGLTLPNKVIHMSLISTTPLRSASRQLLHTTKMPAFVLHGGRSSTNTMRVRLTLSEGNFDDYAFANINLLKGEQKVNRHSFVQTTLLRKYRKSHMGSSHRNTNFH